MEGFYGMGFKERKMLKNKYILLGVVLYLILSSDGLFGKTKGHGAELHLFMKNGHELAGELIGVKENCLILCQSGIDFSVDIKELKMLKVVKKAHVAQGALMGLVIGAVAGGVGEAVYLSGGSDDEWANFHRIILTIIASAAGGGIGLLTGAVVGSLRGIDETIQVEGKPEAEIEKILLRLRRIARMPEYR